MKKKILVSFFYSFLISVVYSQNGRIINNQVTHFEICNNNEDKIDFIAVDTILKEKKSILLFCQGSLPIPLIFEYPDEKLGLYGGGISNFDFEELKKTFHIIVISMPNTPIEIGRAHV